MKLPRFDRLPENPPGARRPDPEEPSQPDEFQAELQRAKSPPAPPRQQPRRPEPARPEEPTTPEKPSGAPRSAKNPPRKPKHDDHDPPPQQSPTAIPPTPPQPAADAHADADAEAAVTATDTTTATATATAAKPPVAPTTPAPDDTAALDETQIQTETPTPAAEPTPAAASALFSLSAALPDAPTAAPATAATDKPAANPLAASLDETRDASVTIALSAGGNAAPHTGADTGGSASHGDRSAADALLGMRLGAPVRPLARNLVRFEGELAPGILPRGELRAAAPHPTLPTLPIERPEAAEPTDPAAQPGHHRADLTVGDGDQKVVVSVMASEHQVRVHARAVSGDETAALRAGADELRGALKKQGLELAYLGAETMGGQASQERRSHREDSRQSTTSHMGAAPVDESVEAARPDVRVLA